MPAQPLVRQHSSGIGPLCPTLRANPYPEVTDPICRLPLPTLFYRPEAVNLGDLLRIWVRAGAKSPSPTPKFSRSHRPLVDPARTAGLFAKNQNPFSLREDSRGSAAYAEKTTLPRVSVGVFGSFRVATTDTRVRQVTLPGCGIWTTFPFGYDLVSLRFTVKSPNV